MIKDETKKAPKLIEASIERQNGITLCAGPTRLELRPPA